MWPSPAAKSLTQRSEVVPAPLPRLDSSFQTASNWPAIRPYFCSTCATTCASADKAAVRERDDAVALSWAAAYSASFCLPCSCVRVPNLMASATRASILAYSAFLAMASSYLPFMVSICLRLAARAACSSRYSRTASSPMLLALSCFTASASARASRTSARTCLVRASISIILAIKASPSARRAAALSKSLSFK